MTKEKKMQAPEQVMKKSETTRSTAKIQVSPAEKIVIKEIDIDDFMSFIPMTEQELDEIIQLSMND